jgi:Nif-specific regulatory protein
MIRLAREPDLERGEFGTLAGIAEALACSPDLRRALKSVLERLEGRAGALRSAVLMLDEERGEIRIEVSLGFGPRAEGVRYRLGEGITGLVVASGQPVVVPAVSREPRFLHRALRREGPELTFVCVPISAPDKPVGALAVDLAYRESRDNEAAQRFFAVVASMIAQALGMHRKLAEERKRLLEDNGRLRLALQDPYDFSNGVAAGGPMRRAYEQVARAAPSDLDVLIRGEPGTGKAVIAHAIHQGSPRARMPFLRLYLAALPARLVEPELFGCRDGSSPARRGRLELANGGTLFLADVAELSGAAQGRLIRVLRERELERSGGKSRLNVRLLAASSRDLEAALAVEAFREDLYRHLSVLPVFVPALRERKPDIPLLADHFLARYAQRYRKSIRRISTPAIDLMVSHRWPGNVRELESAMEHAVFACQGDAIHAHHLPPSLRAGGNAAPTLGDAVERFEQDLILDAIRSARGNVARAARLLNTSERILGYKARKYQIDPKRLR